MKILLTGFEPFGGEKMNPAYEAIRLLPDMIENCRIIKKEIPVVFDEASEIIYQMICQEKPDIVICVGQAGGRDHISVEFVGINFRDARMPDNQGYQPINETIKKDGDTAYFTKLPVKAMVSEMKKAKIPAEVSYSAGTYVCNDVFYQLLYHIDKHFPQIRGGFIHVPFADEQAKNHPGKPFLPLSMISQGLEAGIRAAIVYPTDVSEIA